MSAELRVEIQRLIDLIDDSSRAAEQNESELRVLLDKLAAAVHDVREPSPPDGPEAPALEYDVVRAKVERRFPNCGLYQDAAVEPCVEALVGDAIDDIADITIDLSEVAWLWDNVGESVALWQFRFGFESHWGSHLRGLQWYLHEREGHG